MFSAHAYFAKLSLKILDKTDTNIADICNGTSITSLNTCLFRDNEIFKEFSFKYSGFQMNAEIAWDKYNDIKNILIMVCVIIEHQRIVNEG